MAAESASLLSIAEVAREFEIRVGALRLYESKGLIKPARRPGRGGSQRVHAQKDLERVATLLKLQTLGFTLLQIKSILAAPTDGPFGLSLAQCEAQMGGPPSAAGAAGCVRNASA